MVDTHSPIPESLPPGIGRIVLVRPEWPEEEGVVMNETTLLQDVLTDAEDARLHVGALIGVLEKCHPSYKIETGLFFGNLQPIHARLVRLIEGLHQLSEAQRW